MGWILLTVLAVVVFAVLVRFRATITRTSQDVVVRREDQDYRVPHSFVTIALAVIVLGWVIYTGGRILNVVDNGHVGLVYTFGAITGHHGDGHGGLVVTAPWQTLEQANVQVQALQPPSSCYNNRYRGCMEAFTSETQDVFISATINVHVDPENIQALYRSVGPDYVTKLILPRVAQITKEEAVKYGAAEIAPRREELRKTIASRLTNELSTRSIKVDDFLVTNVDFRDEFKASIEAKVKAEQDAAAEQNKVAIETAKAEQSRQQGIARANAIREEAQGQADANRTISASLTPELIQFQAVQKLTDKVQLALIPSGQGIIIDPTTLLTPKR